MDHISPGTSVKQTSYDMIKKRMRSKRSFLPRIILLMAFAVPAFMALSACSSSDPLVGTWKEPVSGLTLTFDKSNNVQVSMYETTYQMTYTEQAPNTLIIQVSALGTIPNISVTYRIEKNQLILTVDNTDTILDKVR